MRCDRCRLDPCGCDAETYVIGCLLFASAVMFTAGLIVGMWVGG